MNYQDFIKNIQEFIAERLDKDTSLQVHSIQKNNGTQRDGLVIQQSNINISPTIYLDSYYQLYQEGATIEELCENILAVYDKHRPIQNFDVDIFTNYKQAATRIVPKLVHYASNAKLLQELPHLRYLDLAIVFQYLLDTEDENHASILIRQEHRVMWNVTVLDLHQAALKNAPTLLPHQLMKLSDVLGLQDWICEQAEESADFYEDATMYILTNERHIHGASTLLYPQVLQHLSEQFDSDLILFPSSIHEILIMPKTPDADAEHYSKIVREVNAQVVREDEFLSDHVYLFSKADQVVRYL